jgi:hypothetical protein
VAGFLVDPHGQPLDVQSTVTEGVAGPAMQFFRRAPAPGRWSVIVFLNAPIDGARLEEPFTGRIDFAPFRVEAAGLPSSATTVLPAGRPVTATFSFVNTGSARKDFFADARLNQRTALRLLGGDVTGVGLPMAITAQPHFLVPTGTDQLVVAAHGTVPVVMDVTALNGSPDRLGMSLPGNYAVAQASAPELAPGFWFAIPEAIGPFPPEGVGAATVDLGALAESFAFDPAVVANSGDAWRQSVDATAPYTPLRLDPGQSGTITLTITPSGPRGTVVRGFVALDTLNLTTLSGDEPTTIPYEYRIG